MRAIVVDDEDNIRLTTVTLLQALCPDVEVVGEANSVKTAVKSISKNQPDLVFMDIEMEDGTGFDVVSRLPDSKFRVIFITAHDAYAIKAFRFAALDYLLKPLDADELKKAVKRAQDHFGRVNLQKSQLEVLEGHKDGTALDKIVLSDAENIHLVSIQDILRCESSTNYTLFHLKNGEKIMVSKPLKEYDQLLSDKQFFRTHQSHLINLKHFARYEKKDGGSAVLTSGERVPVATRKKENLINALKGV